MITLESYGQHGIRDCESTHDRMTNWLYLFLITLASVNLLQYHMRLGGGPRQSHSLGTNGGMGGGFRDSRIVLGLMEEGGWVLRQSRSLGTREIFLGSLWVA